MKTIYMLRVRYTDKEDWGPATAYRSRRERDYDAALNRSFGGIRTHSYEERVRPDGFEKVIQL